MIRSRFILMNTQSGKTSASCGLISGWLDVGLSLAVLVVDNDCMLADQILCSISRLSGIEVYLLSSHHSVSMKSVIESIMLREAGGQMPVVIALSNHHQLKKVSYLCDYASSYSVLIDEADKTYNTARRYLRDSLGSECMRELVFVSATEGGLPSTYEECYRSCIHRSGAEPSNYRAIHTDDSCISIVKNSDWYSNNDIAIMLVKENLCYFERPILLPSGERYYRKVLINSGVSLLCMEELARHFAGLGWGAITINCNGITLWHASKAPEVFKTKCASSINEILMYIYKSRGLDSAPLAVIGNRKVSRGIGFHYAPRSSASGIISVDNCECIELCEGEGLIFTDEILGNIQGKSTAVQKAGRLAGIISQCPQYIGNIKFWCSSSTRTNVLAHNTAVAGLNLSNSATTLGEAFIPGFNLSETFNSMESAEEWCETNIPSKKYSMQRPSHIRIRRYGWEYSEVSLDFKSLIKWSKVNVAQIEKRAQIVKLDKTKFVVVYTM